MAHLASMDEKRPFPHASLADARPARRGCFKLRQFLCVLLAGAATVYYGYLFLHWKNSSPPAPATTTKRTYFRLDVPAGKHVAELHAELRLFGVDVWAVRPRSIDFLVTGDNGILKALGRAFQGLKVIYDDVSVLLAAERTARLEATAKRGPTFVNNTKWFQNYHSYEEIVQWYTDLAQTIPHRVRILPSIGKTHQGRPIMAISITNQTAALELANAPDARPRFYIQAGIHAREWISPATCQYISKQLATVDSAEIIDILNLGEFLIIPMLNADGYAYTWSDDRLWRKNRSPIKMNGQRYFGVDLNRNFDSNWGGGGSSDYPDSETYMGPSAGSEEEVKAVVQFFNSYPDIVMALDLHSYSQLILRPIGWQQEPSEHEEQLSRVSSAMAKIIKSKHNKKYIAEKSVDLYSTTGTADDWFYMQVKQIKKENAGTLQIRPYALTIELRPNSDLFGGPGFILDKSEIIPTGEEILPAVLHLARESVSSPLVITKSSE